MPVQAPKPPRNRAQKSLDALGGDDDFSTGKGTQKRPKVELRPGVKDEPLPATIPAPTRDRNLLIRLFAKIFR